MDMALIDLARMRPYKRRNFRSARGKFRAASVELGIGLVCRVLWAPDEG
jgi:hypothetical protein